MKTRIYILLVLFIFLSVLTSVGISGTLYVPGGGYSTIQSAIDAAVSGVDEIEVAPGTYNEDINFLTKAVRLYSSGGPGVTTIDGTDHHHVVQCVLGEGTDTILEGFTITGGNANGTGSNSQGGGMFIKNSSPTVFNCIFTGNSAVDGGGMCNTDVSNPTVTDCTFTGNSATTDGGGMFNNSSSNPTVTNCIFSGNSADYGGGMFNNSSSSPAVTNCIFSGNSTSRGGGMFNLSSSPTMTNCTFSGNLATEFGGGMRNESCSPTMINCTFSGNSAQDEGGGMYNYNSYPAVTNCTFSGNTAGDGGGMYNWSNSNATVTNCILWGNTPDEIYNTTSTPIVTYSNVQGGYTGTGNIDADPLFIDAAVGDFRFISSGSPCVDTGNNSVVTEPNDLAGNPRVVDGDWNGTATVDMGAYELQSKQIHNITRDTWYMTIQMAIDDAVSADQIEVGPATYNEAIDFIGKAVELYSSGGPEVTTIDASGLDASVVTCINGEGILQGFTITGGSGTTVGGYKFGGGMYNVESSPTVTNCIFTLNSVTGDGGGMYNRPANPTVTNCTFFDNHAAYAGGGMDNRSASSPTVTDCTFDQNTAGTNGGGMENYYHSNSIVINCTFSGNASSIDAGGMFNHTSSPTVTACTFNANGSGQHGGGMYNYFSNSTVTDCIFTLNSVVGEGGGMFNHTCSPMVTHCSFSGNTADLYGGGMGNYSSNPTVINCWFTENTGSYGGGMFNDYSSPTVTNCIFTRNSTSSGSGAGMANYNSSHSIVTNCTIYDNTTAGSGGGIRNYKSGPTVTNCIVWDNAPDEISNESSSPVISYCNILGGHAGTGNIDVDPNFVDAYNPDPNLIDLRLLPVSACIDAGDTAAVPQSVFVDMDGNSRAVDAPTSPDTGITLLGVTVDMGAYEFGPCVIEGDINCDGRVDLIDISMLAANWLYGV